jgi:uroporphyrinogen-III synthase
MRVIVTRPRAQAEPLVAALRNVGIDAVTLALIDIVPPADPAPLRGLWHALPDHALLMFVSANAVQHFFAERPAGAVWPPATLAASTGPGTSAALRAAGVPETALVEPAGEVFDSEALWQQLRLRVWRGRRVAVLRGESGRDWLAERFVGAGAAVEFVTAYARCLPQLTADETALLDAAAARPGDHLWIFSSSEAVANLRLLAAQADWSYAQAVAPHARIVEAARRLGFGRVEQAAVDAAALVRRLGAIARGT